jgi:hypothetical protein
MVLLGACNDLSNSGDFMVAKVGNSFCNFVLFYFTKNMEIRQKIFLPNLEYRYLVFLFPKPLPPFEKTVYLVRKSLSTSIAPINIF